MHTGIVLNEVFCAHQPEGIPEQPQRITAIKSALLRTGLLPRLVRIPVREATQAELIRNHAPEYIARLDAACNAFYTNPNAPTFIDSRDAVIGPGTVYIAKLASGSVLNAVDMVRRGDLRNAICIIRPPGHHAEYANATGFCFFNHVALAARHLLEFPEFKKVCILDWDLHHGNGTQNSFYEDDRVFVCNINGEPDTLGYPPEIGYAHETGRGKGVGFNLNFPLPMLTSDQKYREVFEYNVLSAIHQFQPDFILVSAGFDTHKDDPFNFFQLETQTYGWMTSKLKAAADMYCDGRMVLILEGGYNTDVLGDCVVETVMSLLKN